jgi:hypothetical protein
VTQAHHIKDFISSVFTTQNDQVGCDFDTMNSETGGDKLLAAKKMSTKCNSKAKVSSVTSSLVEKNNPLDD